jgi:hypothetical protein
VGGARALPSLGFAASADLFGETNVTNPVRRTAQKPCRFVLTIEVYVGKHEPRGVEVVKRVDVDDCVKSAFYETRAAGDDSAPVAYMEVGRLRP